MAAAWHSAARRRWSSGDSAPEGFLQSIAETCVDIHIIVGQASERFYEELRRYFFVTPTSYLEFISLYISLLEEKRTETTTAINRIKNGKVKMKVRCAGGGPAGVVCRGAGAGRAGAVCRGRGGCGAQHPRPRALCPVLCTQPHAQGCVQSVGLRAMGVTAEGTE